MKLGLSQTDARVYIYLATKGPAKARVMVYNLGINKQQLYRSLKILRNKKIAYSNLTGPSVFIAVPFEKALRILIERKKEQAEDILEKKDELASIWHSINAKDLSS